jgi:Mg2+ and Co2+ transporter CorA
MLEEGHLLIIVHEPPGPDELTRKPVFFWRNSVGEWRSTQGAGLRGMDDLLARFESSLQQLEVAEIRAQTAAQYHAVLEPLAPILRSSRGLHKAIQTARESVKTERELINYRDRAAAIERTAELLMEDAKFGLDFTVAKRAEQQAAASERMNASADKLNTMASLTLPVTALASIFGMELHSGLPDTQQNFIGVLIAGMALGAVLLTWIRKP